MCVQTASARMQLANIFHTGCVIQRDQPAPVWGWAPPASTLFIALRPAPWRSNTSSYTTAVADSTGRFEAMLPPTPAGDGWGILVSTAPISPRCVEGPYLFSCGGFTTFVSDVSFGDVILCLGQSNMQVPVSFSFNATDEMNVGNTIGGTVMVFQVGTAAMSSSDADGVDDVVVSIPWSAASNASLPNFSATCWYSGKSVYLKREGKDAAVPIGLIASSWGGTAIKVHATPAANAACGALYPGGNISAPGADCGLDHSPCAPSCLYRSIIAPLQPLKVAAILWYQGE
jgi:sialate O-acetylesterase